jgi:hypothetical protein
VIVRVNSAGKSHSLLRESESHPILVLSHRDWPDTFDMASPSLDLARHRPMAVFQA